MSEEMDELLELIKKMEYQKAIYDICADFSCHEDKAYQVLKERLGEGAGNVILCVLGKAVEAGDIQAKEMVIHGDGIGEQEDKILNVEVIDNDCVMIQSEPNTIFLETPQDY